MARHSLFHFITCLAPPGHLFTAWNTHSLLNPKWTPGTPKGAGKRSNSRLLIIGPSDQVSLNIFFLIWLFPLWESQKWPTCVWKGLPPTPSGLPECQQTATPPLMPINESKWSYIYFGTAELDPPNLFRNNDWRSGTSWCWLKVRRIIHELSKL